MSEHKLSGMEMMLNSLLKAAGFDPNEIAKNIQITVKGFQDATVALQKRLDAIHAEQQLMNARLERIEMALDIQVENGDIILEHRRISNG